jgi:hypothetical protein
VAATQIPAQKWFFGGRSGQEITWWKGQPCARSIRSGDGVEDERERSVLAARGRRWGAQHCGEGDGGPAVRECPVPAEAGGVGWAAAIRHGMETGALGPVRGRRKMGWPKSTVTFEIYSK